MRSFHPTVEAGEDNACETLDLTEEEVDVCYCFLFTLICLFVSYLYVSSLHFFSSIWQAIQDFLCKNCEYKQHQCSACGKLGSSDKDKGAEV